MRQSSQLTADHGLLAKDAEALEERFERFRQAFTETNARRQAKKANPAQHESTDVPPDSLIVTVDDAAEKSEMRSNADGAATRSPTTIQMGTGSEVAFKTNATSAPSTTAMGEKSMQSAVSTPRFASLPPIGTLPPSLKCGTTVKTLKLPKVVNQILSDCEEHWYHLARSLEERVVQSDLRSVMVISSLQGEGCTTISLCLATAVAKVCRRRILLLDADFGNPGMRHALSLKPKAGLEQVIIEGLPVDKAILKAELPELCVLPMMQGFQYPATMHKNRAMEDLLESLRTHFDLIIIDGGSAFSGRSPTHLTVGVDAALIVRDPNKSGDRLLEQLDLYLTEQEICGLGVIENCVE